MMRCARVRRFREYLLLSVVNGLVLGGPGLAFASPDSKPSESTTVRVAVAGDEGAAIVEVKSTPTDPPPKEKKTKVKVGARVMAGAIWEHEEPRDQQGGEEESKYEIYLRQARIKLGAEYKKLFKLRISADASDGLGTGSRRTAYLRNAYFDVRLHSAFRIRIGQFKRPYSRIALDGAFDTYTTDRGLMYGYSTRNRNDTLSWGMRGLGAMLWGKFDTSIGDSRWYASVSHVDGRQEGIDAHAMWSQEFGQFLRLDVFGAYKHGDQLGRKYDVGAGGAAVSVGWSGLELLVEGHAVQNWRAAATPWGVGALVSARYGFDVGHDWKIGPLAAFEYIDTDMNFQQSESYRAVVGFTTRWRDHFGLWLEGEVVRPRGIAGLDNVFVASERVNLQLGVQF